MKKILTFIICFFAYFVCEAQTPYPISSTFGGPTTLVKTPQFGAVKGGLIPYVFNDTSSANSALTYGKYYDGFQIKTLTPINAMWWRDSTHQVWVQYVPGGGGTGTLSWNMGGNNPIVSDGSGYGLIGPQTNNGLSAITNNTVRLSINTNGALGLGSSRDFGTSGYVLTSQGSGSAPIWAAASGSTPTWQQTLTAGSTLNTNNTISMGNTSFIWSGGVGSSLEATIGQFSLETLQGGVAFSPYTGQFLIDTLNNETFQNQLMGWTSTSGANRGKVGYITIGTGLSLSGGQLTNTGVLANPTWQQTLTAGSTLTGANTVAGGGFAFEFNNASTYDLKSTSNMTFLSRAGAGSHPRSSISLSTSTITFNSLDDGGSIGDYKFTDLQNNTSQDRVIGQASSSGTLGYITLGTTNGFTSSLSSGAFSLTTTVTNNQLMYSSSGAVTGSSNLTYNGTTLAYASGVTTGSTTTSGLTETYNSLTTGTGNYISSSSITTGNLLNLVSSSTAANGFSLANLSSSGANANSTRTATGLTISVTNTGTSSTNVGLNVTASGGTTNRAISSTGTVRMTSLGTASGDTTTYKPMGINSSGDLIGMTYWPGSGGGGTPAGSNTQIQYNNSGAFGASANFTYDGARISLTRNTADDIMNVLLTSGHDAGITFKHSNPIYKMSIWMDDAAANLNFGNTLGSTPAFVLFRSSNNMTVGGTSDGGYRFDVQTGGARIIESAYLATGSGNVGIGGTTAGASAAASLGIFNGTAPTGSITNGIILYAEDVAASSELKVRDEAGNITVLSPHNFSKLPTGKPSEDLAWSYYSERNGKYISVDMAKAIRTIEELTQRVGTLEQKLQLKSKPPVKLIYKGKVKK